MKEVEHETGKPISFNFDTIPSAQYVRINELVQAMWLKAGIHCTIQEIEQAELIQNAISPASSRRRPGSSSTARTPTGTTCGGARRAWQPIGGLVPEHGAELRPAHPAGAPDRSREHRPADAELSPTRRWRAGSRSTFPTCGRTAPCGWWLRANHVQNFAGPTFPDGNKRLAMIGGVVSPSEIWRST